ncbi:Pre-mRNA splicing factor PRP21 like protein-domain-containing protein [Radiomyces spectabilis]|uniref:Pre-mRNA splicing factor PRP21 like protein-domain-containing protein n=1 Tax=Radiomyces spectabilis TaxID=64574 RepID=UPI00221E78A1|nr:Pre-mRNA splicing factor PRP21 like protein-domain-containing protein [Radiomyces spectabilis]KAI8370651.1 Pre-mRNA splicing factor PRP21 like protein-domain-containing protein [Radiomyces spectabilis]
MHIININSTKQEKENAPKEAEPFEFSAPMPAMSAQDLDIMKLTAQFAARNGRQFITQLAQRESRNYQFDFLRPSHSLFPYFTELVKQYTKVLVPPKDLKDRLRKNIENKYRILDRVKERAEWVVWLEAERKKKESEDEKERIAYASIDWHDFVIVETVEFTEADEQTDLPPPMSLSELENMSLAQKRFAAMPEPTAEEEAAEDVEMDMDDSDEEQEGKADAAPAVPVAPDMNAPIKIRTNYKPKIIGATPAKVDEPTQICPRCGEAIPVSEMDEHMRIELLDPKWKEQKQAMEAKKKDSNLLQEGTDVAKILKNFSGYRSDIFGSEETEIGKKIKAAEEEAKRRDKVIWDGHTATKTLATQRAAQNMIDSQIAAIHSKNTTATDESFGPRMPGQMESPTAYASPTPHGPPHGQYYGAPQPVGGSMPPPPPFANQLPDMYNQGMGMPMPAPPTPMAPPADLTRKAEQEPEGQMEAKKPRLDSSTPTEGDWANQEPTTVSLTIQTPNMPDKPEWQLTGASITIADLPLSTLVSTVKDRISSQLGMPAGKQKLSLNNTIMNNGKSLSFYGVVDGSTLQLGLKDRGKK